MANKLDIHYVLAKMWWGALTPEQREFMISHLNLKTSGENVRMLKAYNFDGVWLHVPGWPQRKKL